MKYQLASMVLLQLRKRVIGVTRSFFPQHDVLISVSTDKAGLHYTADHPNRVLITYVKRIEGTDAFMVSGVLK